MSVALYDWLLLEFYLTGIFTVPLDPHCAIVVIIQFPQNKVLYGSCYLKQQHSLTHQVKSTLYLQIHSVLKQTHTLLHWKTSPSSNCKVKTPTGSSWIERPQNLLFRLLSPQNFHPLPSQWHATIMGWWLTCLLHNQLININTHYLSIFHFHFHLKKKSIMFLYWKEMKTVILFSIYNP